MRLLRRQIVLLGVLAAACAPLRGLLSSRGAAPEDLAAGVTVVRDEWGVPSVLGRTDAHVAFGFGYVQAEDEWWQIEEEYLHALGRASHWYGEQYLAHDLVRAVFEVERRAREEYEREPPDRRAIWDAFAAGLNYYLRTAGVRPRQIMQFEPWMPFALMQTPNAKMAIDGVYLGDVAALAEGSAASPRSAVAAADADAGAFDAAAVLWAVASSRAEPGHALLLHSTLGDFFGTGRRYEAMLLSEEGWHVRGFAVLGTPVPRSGHNDRIAWAHTTTAADGADIYEVTFDHPSDPLMYRYDSGWSRAVEWQDTLLVNSAIGVAERVFTFRRTHHGPVVAMRDGRALVARIARMDEGGALQQSYAMGRARDLAGFRAALDARAIAANTMYADSDGNILHVHGGAVPVRDPEVDWMQIVDGSTSSTEWRGYHALDELPQVLNPESGRIAASASSPPVAAAEAARFGKYMGVHRAAGRADRSGLLRTDSTWTIDELTAAAFDTYVPDSRSIEALAAEWEAVGGRNPARARRLDSVVDLLRAWDRTVSLDSEVATLFILWHERLRALDRSGEFRLFRAMEDVVAALERDWGSSSVPWGEMNRLQRVDRTAESFSDDRPSLPVAGGPEEMSGMFAFTSRSQTAARRRYGISGVTSVSVVELAAAIRSRSVVTFGQSGDSSSVHWFDQAPLYTRGVLKEAPFHRADVLARARRTYRPGAAVR